MTTSCKPAHILICTSSNTDAVDSDKFFEKQVRVTETFYIDQFGGDLDCRRFEDYEHIPDDYFCDTSLYISPGVSTVAMASGLQLGLASIIALTLTL